MYLGSLGKGKGAFVGNGNRDAKSKWLEQIVAFCRHYIVLWVVHTVGLSEVLGYIV